MVNLLNVAGGMATGALARKREKRAYDFEEAQTKATTATATATATAKSLQAAIAKYAAAGGTDSAVLGATDITVVNTALGKLVKDSKDREEALNLNVRKTEFDKEGIPYVPIMGKGNNPNQAVPIFSSVPKYKSSFFSKEGKGVGNEQTLHAVFSNLNTLDTKLSRNVAKFGNTKTYGNKNALYNRDVLVERTIDIIPQIMQPLLIHAKTYDISNFENADSFIDSFFPNLKRNAEASGQYNNLSSVVSEELYKLGADNNDDVNFNTGGESSNFRVSEFKPDPKKDIDVEVLSDLTPNFIKPLNKQTVIKHFPSVQIMSAIDSTKHPDKIDPNNPLLNRYGLVSINKNIQKSIENSKERSGGPNAKNLVTSFLYPNRKAEDVIDNTTMYNELAIQDAHINPLTKKVNVRLGKGKSIGASGDIIVTPKVQEQETRLVRKMTSIQSSTNKALISVDGIKNLITRQGISQLIVDSKGELKVSIQALERLVDTKLPVDIKDGTKISTQNFVEFLMRQSNLGQLSEKAEIALQNLGIKNVAAAPTRVGLLISGLVDNVKGLVTEFRAHKNSVSRNASDVFNRVDQNIENFNNDADYSRTKKSNGEIQKSSSILRKAENDLQNSLTELENATTTEARLRAYAQSKMLFYKINLAYQYATAAQGGGEGGARTISDADFRFAFQALFASSGEALLGVIDTIEAQMQVQNEMSATLIRVGNKGQGRSVKYYPHFANVARVHIEQLETKLTNLRAQDLGNILSGQKETQQKSGEEPIQQAILNNQYSIQEQRNLGDLTNRINNFTTKKTTVRDDKNQPLEYSVNFASAGGGAGYTPEEIKDTFMRSIDKDIVPAVTDVLTDNGKLDKNDITLDDINSKIVKLQRAIFNQNSVNTFGLLRIESMTRKGKELEKRFGSNEDNLNVIIKSWIENGKFNKPTDERSDRELAEDVILERIRNIIVSTALKRIGIFDKLSKQQLPEFKKPLNQKEMM